MRTGSRGTFLGVAKRLILFSILSSTLAVGFMNCGKGGFKIDDSGSASFGSLGADPTVALKFDDSIPDVMNAHNASVGYSATASGNLYDLKCYLNSSALSVCTSPIDLSSAPEGDQTLQISAVNKNGLVLNQISRTFRIDRKAPVLSVTSFPSGVIGSTAVTLQFSATDNYSQTSEVQIECSLDSASFSACASPKTYSSLSVGAHSVQLRAVDKAKNISEITVVSFTVSIGLPTVTISQSPAAYINTTTASFSFAGSSGNSTIHGYECSLDGKNFLACTSPKTYSGLTNNTYTFSVRAIDALGQISGLAKASVVVDMNAPPAPTVTANASSPSKQTALSLSFSSNDTSGIASYQCSLDDATLFTTCTSPKAYSGLTSGSHIFRVRAMDQAGNTSSDGTFVMVTDLEAPILSITMKPANPTTDTAASFSFTSNDALSGVNLTECQLDTEQSYSNCSSPKSYSSVPVGNRVFSLRVTDKAGNSAVQNYAWTVTSAATPTPPPVVTPTPGGGGNPLTSIDTGTDPVFVEGGAALSVSGAQVTVKAVNRGVTTAAGIYDANGTLVRTLWRKVVLAQGQSTSMTWDYKDDLGQTVVDAAYKVKVIAHNVGYKWQGVIGNTSHPGADGAVTVSDYPVPVIKGIYRGFNPILSMAFAPNGASIYTVGYNEAWHPLNRGDVGTQKSTWLGKPDFQRIFDHVATDGIMSYGSNSGLGTLNGGGIFDHPENFIVGFKVSDNSLFNFSAGIPWTNGTAPDYNLYDKVIDTSIDGSDKIRGLAVEVNGNNLYVAHKMSGIKILNKTTGACKVPVSAGVCGASLAVNDPYDIALSPNGDLWVSVGRTEIRKYTNPGTNPTLALTIKGFSQVVGLAVSPLTQTLVVADGGVNQQVKGFNSQTGAALWTHGVKGGYNASNGVDVTPNKLYLSGSNLNDTNNNYVAFEPSVAEEIFWVGDPGNFRNLKFKLPATPAAVNPLVYLDNIMFIPASYNASVDQTDPTRVFSNWLEFKIDYSKPITKSWTLVRNYTFSIPAGHPTGGFSGARFVYTVQGHTYAMISREPSPGAHDNMIVELTTAGLRDTGVKFIYGSSMEENMSVRYSRKSGSTYQIIQRSMTGLDAKNNPIFGAEVVVASAPLMNAAGLNPLHTTTCAVGANEETFPKTSSNLIITFNPCIEAASDKSNHLGGIKAGANDYSFRASPAATWAIQSGTNLVVSSDGTFNNVLGGPFAASRSITSGRNVIYNYFGEFFYNGQANQWIHYLDNGLFVGQFGTANYNFSSRFQIPIGTAGNSFSPFMVHVDGNYYIYHNDENAHSGVHRWRITNLNSLEEMAGNIGKNVSVTNPGSIVSTRMAP